MGYTHPDMEEPHYGMSKFEMNPALHNLRFQLITGMTAYANIALGDLANLAQSSLFI